MIESLEFIGTLVIGTLSLAAILLMSNAVAGHGLGSPRHGAQLRLLHLLASGCLGFVSYGILRLVAHV